MKSIYALATVALFTAGAVNAQTLTNKTVSECAANQAANAQVIAKAQAAKTPAARLAIVKAAVDADPSNAACLVDMALQMSLSVDPAAGPEEFGATPTTTDGTAAPAENPSQLNQPAGTGTPSAAVPAI